MDILDTKLINKKFVEESCKLTKEICAPFFDNTPIENVIYMEFYLDGGYNYLTTSMDYYMFMFENFFYIDTDALKGFIEMLPVTNGFFLNKHYEDQTLLNILKKDYSSNTNGKAPLSYDFNYIRKLQDKFIYFAFKSESERDDLELYYLSNFKLFDLFIEYFMKNITKMDKYLSGRQMIYLPFDAKIETVNFYHSFGPENNDFKNFIFSAMPKQNISKKLKEVLKWYYLGKTYDEIAVIMGISKRTVEKHFYRLRQQLNCSTNSQMLTELIKKGELFQDIIQ